ncbi:MAG TPA: efflux RND transporter periplasmic adaptor subunit [Gemmatimonadaceae bacterium]|nr:efflux RND transporter periplasmic adaptor subunit [Gemmatimonadaceae bacterium]
MQLRRASLPIIAVSLPLILGTGCKAKQERQQRQVPTVSVVPARRATVPYVIEANGVVTPLQSAAVISQVDGIVLSVDFQEGQEVRQDQPLFRIDPRPYQNAYEAAAAVLARDSANLVNARAQAERYKRLLSAKVITQEEGDQQLTTAATTEATLRADRAAVEQAKFNLENTIVRAPIGGKTGSLLVRRGNLVRAGAATPLVVINQVRPILVRFAIPSSQLPVVLQYGAQGGLPVAAVPGGVAPASPSIDSLAAAAMAQPADAGAGGGAMHGVSNGDPGGAGAGAQAALGQQAMQQGGPIGERLSGKLSFIDNAVDTATGTVQLKATFDNSNGRLWAGQYATTSLHLYDEENALVVPQSAIVTGQRGSYVYVVDRADTARQRAVIVERMSGPLAIISTGIQEGDRVVTDGQSRLTPDSPVKIRGANDNGTGGRRGGRKGGPTAAPGGAANVGPSRADAGNAAGTLAPDSANGAQAGAPRRGRRSR